MGIQSNTRWKAVQYVQVQIAIAVLEHANSIGAILIAMPASADQLAINPSRPFDESGAHLVNADAHGAIADVECKE